MRHRNRSTIALAAAALSLGLTGAANAVTIVNDTWIDGTRTDPTAGVAGYSENGIDSDADGDIESAWYRSGSGAMTVTPGGPLVTTTLATGANSWTTHFTSEATPVTLAAAGDAMTVTWVFTPTGVNETNTGRDLRIAIVNSPEASRVSSDAAPGDADYDGYGIFSNMGQTLGSSMTLYERKDASGAFLSSTGAYEFRAGAGTTGAVGFADGTQYTVTFSATRTVADALDITVAITGGSIDNDGSMILNFTDTTPNSFAFDTFGIRPSSQAGTAAQFNTSRFTVEYSPIPEPASLALVGLGGLALITRPRK